MSAVRRLGKGKDTVVVRSVVAYSDRARDLIKGFKYDGELGHAGYLGHLLFRQLDRRWEPHELDRVLANPTHPHRGVRHTELLVEAMAAADKGRRWVFDDPADPCLVKTRPTVAAHGRDVEGRQAAAGAVERSLVVARPDLVEGQRLLVVDDVVTTGAQMQTVSRVLRDHGAADVQGLVVAAVTSPAVARSEKDLDPLSKRALQRFDNLGHRPPGTDGMSL